MKRLVLFAVCAIGALLVRAADVVLPDPKTGVIDGKTALLFWPGSMPASRDDEVRPLPSAAGCEVHMVPHADLNRELLYPCGKWFAPPVGRYNFWIEKDGWIAPTPYVANYAGSPFQGAGLMGLTWIVPAGRVSVPQDRRLAEGEQLRILSLERNDWWNRDARIFDRRVSASAPQPVQMPVGRVVVGRFDKKTGDAIALSKPVSVKSGGTTSVWPSAPATSDVLVVLEKPELRLGVTTTLKLNDGERTRAPDVFIDSERIIAIWYGVDARVATVSVTSDSFFLAPREIRLTPGKVTTVRARLERLPKVSVLIDVPEGTALPEELTISVARAGAEEPLRRVPAKLGTSEIDALPAEPMQVTLHIDRWKFHRAVDLTSGADATVEFHLQPLRIEGTVYHGDKAARADVGFHNGTGKDGDDWIRVTSDERGHYEATLWRKGNYTVQIRMPTGAPYLDGFRWIEESGTVDFHVPRSDYRVRVRDRATNLGIAGAEVSVGNSWLDHDKQQRDAAQLVRTDDDGVAILPPLHKGDAFINIRAKGYASPETLQTVVDEQSHELVFALEQLQIAGRLVVLLPNRAPAAGAEVMAVDSAMEPLWQGTTASDGSIELPRNAGGALLLIRHPNAAAFARRWNAKEETWRLSAPAEPLNLVVEARSGQRVNGAHLVVWIDGVRLSGLPLTFLTGAVPATNASGIWTGRNLPAKPLRVLALPRNAGASIASPAFDIVAADVSYPWPSSVTTLVAQ